MKTFPTLALLFAPLITFAAAPQPPADKLVLVIDGKRVPVEPGKPAKIEGSFTNPTVSVEKLPFKTFAHSDLSFDYPTEMTWEYENDGDGHTYTLSGNDFKIIIFATQATPEGYLAEFGKTFRSKDGATPSERTINGIKIKGLKLDTVLVKQRVVTEAYSLKTKSGRVLVSFQDFPGEKPESTEATRILKVLGSTFQVGR